jgi:hypothetical protein
MKTWNVCGTCAVKRFYAVEAETAEEAEKLVRSGEADEIDDCETFEEWLGIPATEDKESDDQA